MSINKLNMPTSKIVFDKKRLDETCNEAKQIEKKEQAEGNDINTDTLDKVADFAESKPTDFINRLGFEDLQKSLHDLNPEQLSALLKHLSAAELSQLNLSDLNLIDPAAFRQLLEFLNSANIKELIQLDPAQLTSALGQLKHEDLQALIGHLPPSTLRDVFNRLDESQFLDIVTSSPLLAESFAEQFDLNSEHLQQLMEEVKDTCTIEQQEVLDGLLACQTEEEMLTFADEHEGVFLGSSGGAGDIESVYDTQKTNQPKFMLKADNYLARSYGGSGKGDITKLMIFLFMDMYEVRSDILRRNAADLTAIKDNTKELNKWWDAVRDMGTVKLEDFDLPVGDKTTAWTSKPPSPQEIMEKYENLSDDNPIKKKYSKLIDTIKSSPDFADFIDTQTGKLNITSQTSEQFLDRINSHLNKLCDDLQCDAKTNLFEKDKTTNKYVMPSTWGDKVDEFKRRAAEANTIQQSAATLMNAESSNLQTLNNMQTKLMETRQAILQKITSM